MSVTIQASQVIDRPLADVFRFHAREHVSNHPRWDPDIELWLDSSEPLAVGTLIRRRNIRSGAPVEGTMQVVEFDPERAFAVVIHDGPAEMRGRSTYEALTPGQTRLTTTVEIPGMDAAADTSFIAGRLQRSLDHIKQLIESEVAPV